MLAIPHNVWYYILRTKQKGQARKEQDMVKTLKEYEKTKKNIERLEKELKKCKDAKRRTFIKVTINIESEQIGEKEPYPFL